MALLLKIVGAVWALIGMANISGMPWKEFSSGWLTFGLLFNMLLFIVPGLILYGLGALVARRRRINQPSPETHVKCPDCAELVLREAKVCKHCGCRLVPQPALEPKPYSEV